ncbi:MAG: hypothetical protein NVS3B12_15420 [Acidimicrobiales bacterium]
MGEPGVDVIMWGPERARAGPWRGDQAVAFLTPLADAPVPSAAFVRRCLDTLSARGYHRVITGALSASESHGFLEAGFEVSERLHLLSHDLRVIPPAPPWSHRRAGWRDDPHVLVVDHMAFPAFWQLDGIGLREALRATPRSRYRVAGNQASASVGGADEACGGIIGYAITGRSGRRGYIQRLAVHPDCRGAGLGAALVTDGLHWLRRWKVQQAIVNTQFDNGRALALYERLGFTREPLGLSVLSAGLA